MSNNREPAPKHEQPIGFVILDKLLEGDELEQCKQEVQAMMDAYDGSVPFPEYAEQYMQFHPSQWDFRALAQFLMPPNDPRNKLAPKHDGSLGGGDRISYNHYYRRPAHVQINVQSDGFEITDDMGEIAISPIKALSLLAWLKQEKAELQRMAKEQESVDNPLQGVSNVIELKPEHKYLLVFKGTYTPSQLEPIIVQLHQLSIKSMGIALSGDDDLQVIEVPEEQQ